MSGLEWFLVIVVVILVPLAIAVGVTLWTLEMARRRSKRHRGARAVGLKRRATRPARPEPNVTRQVAQRDGADSGEGST
ncbi:MAG: hypothetical protein H0W06_04370 [Chloroflexia bacterium]|nr:hypothetical protein [Chloroflexia bacterium]